MDHPHSSQRNITDTSPIFASQPDQSSQTRLPLSNRANIRVDSAVKWEHKDSSEDQPSTHDSICNAAWISTSDFAKSPYQTPGRPVTPPRSLDIDLGSESPLSRLETPFLYGYGTELAPILEQRSIATLRTKGSLSTSDLSSLLHDAPGTCESSKKARSKSDDTIVQVRQHRGQKHKNFDDIIPTAHLRDQVDQPSPQLKCLAYSRPTVHVVDVHSYPRKPIYPPPQPSVTPPSLIRINHPQSDGKSYIDNTAPRAIAYEAPDFRLPRSGHGNLAAHPFVRQARMGDGYRPSTSRMPRGVDHASCRSSLNMRYHAQRSRHDSLESPNDNYYSQWDVRDGPCRKCRHPRGELWSLSSTLVGHGPGMRRGSDWCSRCACRKIVRLCCCVE